MIDIDHELQLAIAEWKQNLRDEGATEEEIEQRLEAFMDGFYHMVEYDGASSDGGKGE